MFLQQPAWLFFLALGLLNLVAIQRRLRPLCASIPELAAGYRRLLYGAVFWMCLPWLVMGVGSTVGGVPTIIHFLRPATGGPFAWAFVAVVYAEFLLLGWWAIWGGGAEALVRHPGVISFRTDSVVTMRRFLVGSVVFALVWNTGFLIWLA